MSNEAITLKVQTLFDSLRPSQENYYQTHGVYEQTTELHGDGFTYRCSSHGQPDGWSLVASALIDGLDQQMMLDCGIDPTRAYGWSIKNQ